MSDYYDSNSKCIVLNPVYHTKKNGTQTSIPCSEFGKKQAFPWIVLYIPKCYIFQKTENLSTLFYIKKTLILPNQEPNNLLSRILMFELQIFSNVRKKNMLVNPHKSYRKTGFVLGLYYDSIINYFLSVKNNDEPNMLKKMQSFSIWSRKSNLVLFFYSYS